MASNSLPQGVRQNAMTVGDLIDVLEGFDPDLHVVVWADDGKPWLHNVGRVKQIRIDYERSGGPQIWNGDSKTDHLKRGVIIA